MKPLLYQLSSLLLAAGLCSVASSQSSIVAPDTTKKPYLVVTPAQPRATLDTVSLQIMIGTASNSCMAPTFSNCTFTIEQSPLTIYPPLFTVTVKFVQDPFPADKMCTMNYSPVDYGPMFRLGVLRAGSYSVVGEDLSIISSSGIKTYGTFSVSESAVPLAYTIKGTVYDDPSPLKRASMPVAKAKIYLAPNVIPLAAADAASSDRMVPVLPRDSAITDASGNYSFSAVSAGSYRLTCYHPDYRSVSVSASVRKDTAINFIMVPVSAGATVTGIVTFRTKPEYSATTPVAGCTVTVSSGDVAITSSSIIAKPLLRAITDKEGRYTISQIPIGANGETWIVRASRGVYSEVKRVALYNMRTDTVNFFFSAPYENSDSVTALGAVFKISADKFTYQAKEGIKIRYSITNTTRTTLTFGPFSKGCEYDLILTGGTSTSTATVMYQASDNSVCLDVEHYITVDPGVTVTHDFPALYLSDLKWPESGLLTAPRSITLMVASRLQGAKYDSTRVDVSVVMELTPVATASVVRNNGVSDASFDSRSGKLSLSIDKEQQVSVACYTLGGAVIGGTAMSKRMPAGMHTLAVRNLPSSSGMYIVNVQGGNFSKRFTSVGVGR